MEGLFQPTHLFFLLLLGLIFLFLLYRVLRAVIRAILFDEPRQAAPPAEDIVRERYARGEINRAQFEQMLDDLRKTRSGP